MSSVKINNVVVTAERDVSLPSTEYVVVVENEAGEAETGFTFYVDSDCRIHLHRHPNTGVGLVEEDDSPDAEHLQPDGSRAAMEYVQGHHGSEME